MSFWVVAAPTWLQGVGTVGAFATGGVILLRELRRDRSLQEVHEARQAGAISAWLIRTEPDAVGHVMARCALSNASESPIYDLAVYYVADREPNVVDRVGVLPPGRIERQPPDSHEELWIKAAGGWFRSKASSDAPVADPHQEAWPCQVALEFRDAAGVQWRRDVDGTLRRV